MKQFVLVLAESLSYPPHTKLLIIHADDLAVASRDQVPGLLASDGTLWPEVERAMKDGIRTPLRDDRPPGLR